MRTRPERLLHFTPVPLAVLFAFVACCAAAQFASAATPAEVEARIGTAKAWLYSQQDAGTWEKYRSKDYDDGQAGGLTALCTYALLASGEPQDDPRIKSAVDYLRKANITGVYAIGCRAQIWHYLPKTPENVQAMQRDCKLILNGMGKDPTTKGFYGYTLGSATGQHHSPSQYGVLGAWACEQAGAEIPVTYWQTIDAAWRRTQQPDGGWSYYFAPDAEHCVTPAMTAAGVASLFITQDYLIGARATGECKGNVSDRSIDLGLKYVAANFDSVLKTGSIFYTLYGIERIGVASGRKFFGEHDWYAQGAEFLVRRWTNDGSFGSLPDTCFALLFMSRGRAPVVMNKLEYAGADGKPGNWNERPRDVANLVQWISNENERSLNWQSVTLDVPTVELLDAPILYISGNRDLEFTNAEEQKLKQFCEAGGLILANADCANVTFAQSFRKLGTKLFPSYEFRELPDTHPIYTKQQFLRSKWRVKPSVLSLGNDVRELTILLPAADAARAWQARDARRKSELFELADDIFLYSVDQQDLRTKGETFAVLPDPAIVPTRNATVVRLQYDGNWDPEPGGWKRLQAVLRNQDKLLLNVNILSLEKIDSNGVTLAHLTGTGELKLSTIQRQAIRAFVEAGGTLLVDAAGGSTAFGESVEKEMALMFPESGARLSTSASIVPADDPIYSALKETPPHELFRRFSRSKLGGDSRQPQIRTLNVGGRRAVFYSREDLSTGLVGQPVDGVVGYTPAVATSIVRSLVLSAATSQVAEPVKGDPNPAPTVPTP